MQKEEVNILVVDDVNTMRVQIKELLKTFGFAKISLAGSGEEAKKVLDSETPNLILADWHMTPVDGLEFLKYVRGHDKYKGIAFLMVTAENTRERVAEAIQAGVDDYLIKPLTPAQIQDKVFAVLVKRKVLA